MQVHDKHPKTTETVQAKAGNQSSVSTILAEYKSRVQRHFTEEAPLQGKFTPVQLKKAGEEELLQGKFEATQLQSAEKEEPVLKKENRTGMPDNLKSGIENFSGYSMDDVKVYYNSSKPAQLQAHAYAQGTDIHIGPGHEKHLPHEAWHVIQQKQGRVKPTLQMKDIDVNDNKGLEKEADVMGQTIMDASSQSKEGTKPLLESTTNKTIQYFRGDGLDEKEIEEGERFEALLKKYSELKLAEVPEKSDIDNCIREILEMHESLMWSDEDKKENKRLLPRIEQNYKTILKSLPTGIIDNPNRIGREIEVPSVIILPGEISENGVLLARTNAEELGLPVLKIESEGYGRGLPGQASIELIFGPLCTDDYDTKEFGKALETLFSCFITQRATLKECLTKYNNLLGKGSKYRIDIESVHGCSIKGAQINPNVQTNIAIPYASIGKKGMEGIDSLFKNEGSMGFFEHARKSANELAGVPAAPEAGSSVSAPRAAAFKPAVREKAPSVAASSMAKPGLYAPRTAAFKPTVRKQAPSVAASSIPAPQPTASEREVPQLPAIPSLSSKEAEPEVSIPEGSINTDNIKSLLTQMIYHDLMYGYHEIEHGKEKQNDKQHFHVMFKFSVADAIFSILTEKEIKNLNIWISTSTHKDEIIERIRSVDMGGSARKRDAAKVAAVYSIGSLVNTLKIRESELSPGPKASDEISQSNFPDELEEKYVSTPKAEESYQSSAAASSSLPAMVSDGSSSSAISSSSIKSKTKRALSGVSDKIPISITEEGAKVIHVMPRPSNRIPVMRGPGGVSYVVIEQRSSKHPLNDDFKKRNEYKSKK